MRHASTAWFHCSAARPIPELRIASIIHDKSVSYGRIQSAIRREGCDQCVPRQLVNLFERTRHKIPVRGPVEQMWQMFPVTNADLRESTTTLALALNLVIPVAMLFGIVGIAGTKARA